MIMDVQKNYQSYDDTSPDLKSHSLNIESAKTSVSQSETMLNQKSSKRSFDVAFLMMPDDKMKTKPPEKQLRVSKQLFTNEEWQQTSKRMETFKNSEYSNDYSDSRDQDLEKSFCDDRMRLNNNISPNFGSEINIDVGTDEYPGKSIYCSDSENSDRSRSRPNSNESAAKHRFLPETPYKNKIFDDPSLISMQTRTRYENRYAEKPEVSPKSAFTKVANYSLRSPNSSVSPDNLLYQNSVSPPLSASSTPTNFHKNLAFNNLLTPAHLLNGNSFFKNQQISSTSPNYCDTRHAQGRPGYKTDYHHQEKNMDPKSHPSKLNFLPFRSEIPPYLQTGVSYPFSVQNFQQSNPDFMKIPVAPREPVNSLIVNPAAAILSTLLPPTLAAFSLPAQNVCAKCNISFRMTSDLVYHMRTHHKSESSTDPHRRKREEKLKCPVCNESFRERHHLTRHMTAHQDKEGDLDDGSHSYSKKNKQYFSQGASSLVNK